MTREEMLEAMEIGCDSFRDCSGSENGDCPFRDMPRCPVVEHDQFSDKEIKDAYIVMFNKTNPVSHPSHYTQGNIECIDAMLAAYGKEATAHFCLCNAFKYLWRTKHKNGLEDIDKAIWYLHKYKELVKE